MAEPQVTKREFDILKRELQTLRFLMTRKLGIGSADIKGDLVAPSTVNATLGDDIVGEAELKYESVSVTVSAGQTSGTGVATSGSIIIGWRPTGNNDQFVDNIAISGTTVTITLAAAATADNTFVVILIKS